LKTINLTQTWHPVICLGRWTSSSPDLDLRARLYVTSGVCGFL